MTNFDNCRQLFVSWSGGLPNVRTESRTCPCRPAPKRQRRTGQTPALAAQGRFLARGWPRCSSQQRTGDPSAPGGHSRPRVRPRNDEGASDSSRRPVTCCASWPWSTSPPLAAASWTAIPQRPGDRHRHDSQDEIARELGASKPTVAPRSYTHAGSPGPWKTACTSFSHCSPAARSPPPWWCWNSGLPTPRVFTQERRAWFAAQVADLAATG